MQLFGVADHLSYVKRRKPQLGLTCIRPTCTYVHPDVFCHYTLHGRQLGSSA